MNRYTDTAHERALLHLSIYLDDEDYMDEMWGNYIVDGLEVHPSKAEFDALVPKVLEALHQGQPLPEMDQDVRYAFFHYLADRDNAISASEVANTDIEGWPEAVLEAYISLRQPLLSNQ